MILNLLRRGHTGPPKPPDLEALRVPELLKLHAKVSTTLKDRGIVRSANNPTGDYGEYLFAKAFDWTLANNSTASYDATDSSGAKYQIKSRRLTGGYQASRQLGGIRNLENRSFDYLAVVLFTVDYDVDRAFIMPYELVGPLVRFSNHTNASILRLKDSHWDLEGVRVVTDDLRQAAGV